MFIRYCQFVTLALWPYSPTTMGLGYLLSFLLLTFIWCFPFKFNWFYFLDLTFKLCFDTPPSSLLGPKRVELCWRAEIVGTWCRSQLSALEGVEGACWGSGIRLGKGTSYSLTWTCIKPTNKLVNSHSGAPLVLGQATGNSRFTWLTTSQTRGKPPPSPI
jgi:hypothetical protein